MKRFAPFVLALILTILAASYQRRTGPTWPKSFSAEAGDLHLSGQLVRSGTTGENASVEISSNQKTETEKIFVDYRKYKFETLWTSIPMSFTDSKLTAELPSLPPAGKYEYRISRRQTPELSEPLSPSVVIRFKGAVPAGWLIPHIICMFSAMLLSNLIAMRLLFKQKVSLAWPIWVAGILTVGGMFFGAFVQKFAFGEYWTGFPYGSDLTDNKTLIALLGWLSATALYRKWAKPIALWGAIVLMTAVFLVPHSLGGSELNFQTNELKK